MFKFRIIYFLLILPVMVSGALLLSFTLKVPAKIVKTPPKPNVLFIAVDDLRPELNCYGNRQIISPHLDALAAGGILFENAFCQQAVCSPSRTSLLTGLRPDSTHIYDLQTHFRKTVPQVVTLPQHFKQHGYVTQWWGKIYHAALNDPISWTKDGQTFEPPGNGWRAYVTPANLQIAAQNQGSGPAFEQADVPDNAYPDGKIADQAIASLRQLGQNKKPFFLAVGFLKPHLPFTAPKKYWDLYDPTQIQLPQLISAPENAPELANTNWGELRNYTDIPKAGNLPNAQIRHLIHGYRASVSYTDAQVGRVMAELKKQGLDKNTIVILWGDHGWKLGEYGQWAKHSNYELDARVPLLVRVPGLKNKGRKARGLVELLDIYPTLCELTGLPRPAHLQGISFAALLQNPNLPGKEAAFSQYPRGKIMGYSLRTPRYRFTRWQAKTNPGQVVALELYDLQLDPAARVNIAYQPESQSTVAQLQQLMQKAQIGTRPVRELATAN